MHNNGAQYTDEELKELFTYPKEDSFLDSFWRQIASIISPQTEQKATEPNIGTLPPLITRTPKSTTTTPKSTSTTAESTSTTPTTSTSTTEQPTTTTTPKSTSTTAESTSTTPKSTSTTGKVSMTTKYDEEKNSTQTYELNTNGTLGATNSTLPFQTSSTIGNTTRNSLIGPIGNDSRNVVNNSLVPGIFAGVVILAVAGFFANLLRNSAIKSNSKEVVKPSKIVKPSVLESFEIEESRRQSQDTQRSRNSSIKSNLEEVAKQSELSAESFELNEIKNSRDKSNVTHNVNLDEIVKQENTGKVISFCPKGEHRAGNPNWECKKPVSGKPVGKPKFPSNVSSI
jgi:DNA mismatch repair ATPase MutL